MFQLLKHPDHEMPVLVSVLNPLSLDYFMCGFIKVSSGTRREMENELAEYMENNCMHLSVDFN